MRTAFSRLALVAALATTAGIVACDNDSVLGTAEQVGPPLLDMAFGPALVTTYPTVTSAITAAATRDTITLTLSNLPPVPAGAAYQAFAVDTASGTAVPLAGRLIRTFTSRRPVNRDSSVLVNAIDTVASAAIVAPADTNVRYNWRLQNAAIATGNFIVMSVVPIAQTANATVAAGARWGFSYGRYRAGTSFSSPTLTFGQYANATADRFPFAIVGGATGSFWGDQVRVRVRSLIRPPLGFKYVAWLIDDRTGITYRLGSLVSPVPENAPLDGVDATQCAFCTRDVITDAQIRYTGAPVAFDAYSRITLLLEPKGSADATVPGLSGVLGATMPTSIASRTPGAGKLAGTVTSRTTNPVNGATVYLRGSTSNIPALVGNAGANGVFLFRSVPIGSYKLLSIAPGGTTPSDSVNVVIAAKPGSTVGDSVNVTIRIP
ncbi:MAG: carboxypeptidase-like regulatory domain-containing protein [Gemmatimonadaceae bacterium]|nr:carboxypeptidase-like regulatory domain-containing protein [Gemmatimonadaceae bacterium]